MSGVTRVGFDSAGGTILTGSNNVLINSSPAVRIGDAVQSHSNSEHASPVMVTGSSTVFCNGIPICKAGDSASCGHPSTGSSNVFSN